MAVLMKRLSENKIVDAATAVNAGKVDGFSANQLLRVAFGETGDAPDSNGNVVPGTITAPKAGWLILSGTHTFALTIGSQAAVVFDDASVWALFVPFDGEGNKP